MKFLTRGIDARASRPWVYREPLSDKADAPESSPDLSRSGNLSVFDAHFGHLSSQKDRKLVAGNIHVGPGSQAAETSQHIQEQVGQVTDQTSEATIREAFSGDRISRRFTLDRFGGINANLYNLNFWFLGGAFLPKQVILNQVKDALTEVGDPADLVEGSALISDRAFSSLVNTDAMNKAIRLVESSGSNSRGLKNVSLTTLELLKAILEDRQSRIKPISFEQANDFSAKADNEVWWKQWLRKPFFQKPLYNQKIKVMRERNDKAHNELVSILDGIIQTKEQDVFSARQNLDQAFIKAENAGPNYIDSVGMRGLELGHIARQTIHRILNHPDVFLKSPKSIQGKVPLDFLFGQNFIPIDVLEALKSSKYESSSKDGVNFIDAATKDQEWANSDYNALRTMQGLKERKARLKQFNEASFEKLERIVNQVYEPGETGIDPNNPSAIVDRIKVALESATPGLRQKVTNIIDNNIWSHPTEQFWAIAKYFNDHLETFKLLPPEVQQDFAAFFIAKRTDLEKSLVSGAYTEDASALWRSQALVRGQDVLAKVKDVAKLIPELGSKMLSRDEGVAQNTFQVLQGLVDANDFFTDLVGTEEDAESLISKLPELESGLLHNVFLMKPFIEKTKETLVSLREKRVEYEALFDVDPDFVDSQKAVLEQYQKDVKTVGSGLDDIRTPLFGMGGVSTATGGEGDDTIGTGGAMGGGGLEPRFKTLQREVNELRQTLQGPPGNEDGGQIGAASKLTGYSGFPLIGDIGETLLETADLGDKLIADRVKKIGVKNADAILAQRPTLDDLARLEMGELVSRDIVNTAETFLQNETVQQYQRMIANAKTFVKLDHMYLAEMNFQSKFTVESVTDPMVLKDVEFVRRTRADENDSSGTGLWYQTPEYAIKVLEPRIGGQDHRNVLVWQKTKAERGLGNFITPQGNPHKLATLLTSRPENSAFDDNPLYGVTTENTAAVRKVLATAEA